MVKKENKKNNLIYLVLILLIVICIGVIIFLLIKNQNTLTPEFAPGTIDTNAIKEEDNGDKMDKTDGGGAVSLSYSNVVAVNTKTNDIKMYFKNPSKSRESIVLQIIVKQNDEEYVIAKSELLPPGYTLYNMKINTSKKIPIGGYNGIFRITYYNEDTGEKQIVNTEIDVKIEVS